MPTPESRERTAREIRPPFVLQRRKGEATRKGGGILTQVSTPVPLRQPTRAHAVYRVNVLA